jgi:hypothetical protein
MPAFDNIVVALAMVSMMVKEYFIV